MTHSTDSTTSDDGFLSQLTHRPLWTALAYTALGLLLIALSLVLPFSQAAAVAVALGLLMAVELVRLALRVRERVPDLPWLYAFTVAAVVVVTAVMAGLVLFGVVNGITGWLPGIARTIGIGIGLFAIVYVIVRIDNALTEYILVGVFRLTEPDDEPSD